MEPAKKQSKETDQETDPEIEKMPAHRAASPVHSAMIRTTSGRTLERGPDFGNLKEARFARYVDTRQQHPTRLSFSRDSARDHRGGFRGRRRRGRGGPGIPQKEGMKPTYRKPEPQESHPSPSSIYLNKKLSSVLTCTMPWQWA